MKPRYKHDCEHCKFHGHFGMYDLYSCNHSDKTVIARYSDEPSDNKSGLSFADGLDPELTEAKRRRDIGQVYETNASV